MNNKNIINFLTNIPKIELHLHLEGAIPINAFWKLLEKYDGADKFNNIEDLKNKFIFKDFSHFLENWCWTLQYLREYEDFTFIAEEFATHLYKQNIKYVEAYYSPARLVMQNLEPQKITEAIIRGFNKVNKNIEINLICDLSRDLGVDNGKKLFNQINEVKDMGVIGIGLGGSEHKFPPSPYAEIYEAARTNGFHTTAHAGEVMGPESIWSVIKDLKVERIGHGTSAINDEQLIDFLLTNQTPIEMCPISNLKTGSHNDKKTHPIKALFNKGLNVFVNTDDPTLFNNNLVDEYLYLINEFNFTKADIKKLIENAIKSAWCNNERKSELLNELEVFYDKNTQ